MKNPKSLETNSASPHDIRIVPKVSIIGLTKSGITTLTETLHKRLGLVVISLSNIVEDFCLEHKDKRVKEILN